MECVEGALKTSLRSEVGLKQNPSLGGFEDSLQNNVATCDDDFVDDLLNFSNEDAEDDERLTNDVVELSDKESKRNDNLVLGVDDNNNNNNPPTELTLPADELANLEWLSHFVEDSFSVHSTAPPFLSVSTVNTDNNKPEAKPSDKPCFSTPVPAKARSKRTRTGGRVWSLGSPTLTDSTSSTPTSSSSSSSPTSPWVVAEKQKQKKRVRHRVEPSGSMGTAQVNRRCSHCGVQKTPQWRAGPMGAKTLCNACGVRFKSGRLFPEYRPACSPTFSSDLHSNHHRKVLEMRKKKDPGPVIPVLSSF